MDNFCGIDASLTGSGFAIIVDNEIETMTIKTKPADFKNDLDRVIFISKEICSRIPDDVSLVCMEDYFVAQSAAQMGSSIQLIQLGTTIRLNLYQRNIPLSIIAPSTLKKWVSGKGNVKKAMMIKEVFKRFGYEAADDDQADSIGLAYLAQHLFLFTSGNNCESYQVYQKEVVKKHIKDGKRYNCKF